MNIGIEARMQNYEAAHNLMNVRCGDVRPPLQSYEPAALSRSIGHKTVKDCRSTRHSGGNIRKAQYISELL